MTNLSIEDIQLIPSSILPVLPGERFDLVPNQVAWLVAQLLTANVSVSVASAIMTY